MSLRSVFNLFTVTILCLGSASISRGADIEFDMMETGSGSEMSCAASNTTLVGFGEAMWPSSISGSVACVQCPCRSNENITIGFFATRNCSAGVWSSPDYSECQQSIFITSCNLSVVTIPDLLDTVSQNASMTSEGVNSALNILDVVVAMAGNITNATANSIFDIADMVYTSSADTQTTDIGQRIVDIVEAAANAVELPNTGMATFVLLTYVVQVSRTSAGNDFTTVSSAVRGRGLRGLNVPGGLFTGSERTIVGVFTNRGQFSDNNTVAPFVSISVSGGSNLQSIDPPITFEMEVTQTVGNGMETVCVFWEESTSIWNRRGTRLVSQTTTTIVCSTTHLTVFSALQQPATIGALPVGTSLALAIALPIVAGVVAIVVILAGVLALIMHMKKQKDGYGKPKLNGAGPTGHDNGVRSGDPTVVMSNESANHDLDPEATAWSANM